MKLITGEDRLLREISVQNLAVIENARLEFSGRLTALTGETGAGKSLVVDAIGLVLGDRADSLRVAPGAKKAIVSAVFDCPRDSVAAAELQKQGLEGEDDTVLFVREISAEGRSICRINGRTTFAGIARAVGQHLVELHGQHEHQMLLKPSNHKDLLDEWLGIEAKELREVLGATCDMLRDVESRIAHMEERARERERLIDLYRFEISEIEGAGLVEGEDEQLNAERKRIQNAERLSQEVAAALSALSRGDPCAADLLSTALAALERAAAIDEQLRSVQDLVETAVAHLKEAVAPLQTYEENQVYDPERTAFVEERLDLIHRLKRKYGSSLAEVLEYAERARGALRELEASEETLYELKAEAERLRADIVKACARLTQLREKGAPEFAKLVLDHVRELAMEHARFEVRLTRKEPDSSGAEEVEFLFSANPGHPPLPLAKVASGGEISRVMLAIRCALADACSTPTIVYDEVDTGLGGNTASVVGRKLRQLSRYSQVIVITHLPQIAGQADEQFRVGKVTEADRTKVTVERLEGEERVRELARMLSGDEMQETALLHARELLAVP